MTPPWSAILKVSELSGQMGALTVIYFCPGRSDKCVRRLDKHYGNYCKKSFFQYEKQWSFQKQNKTKLKIGFSEIHPVYEPPGNLLTVSFFISEARKSRTGGQHKTSTMRGRCVKLWNAWVQMFGSASSQLWDRGKIVPFVLQPSHL